ncbi:isoprenylcysteine carboxylmethyltransferase family protein [Actinotalea sp. Marseille-Q4924]|uniref:methyltransferase family protein n=1 Tax=Actinotalea sp. Marseille-Q4924 TaxID=2866571 RepID=UPI001CE439C3|nr:isoprenylcysteine carboxylmethyltransferase family protein [Actinotalea sp. Marseille-Q4924]
MRDDTPLITAQAVALAALAWPGRARWALPAPVTTTAVLAGAAGGALAVAGLAPHGTSITPRVEPPSGSGLHTGGAYGVSRHPIYAGLLVAGGAVAVLRRRPEPLVAWAALVAVLDTKTRREERHLLERFGSVYARYRERTPRLLGLPARRR